MGMEDEAIIASCEMKPFVLHCSASGKLFLKLKFSSGSSSSEAVNTGFYSSKRLQYLYRAVCRETVSSWQVKILKASLREEGVMRNRERNKETNEAMQSK